MMARWTLALGIATASCGRLRFDAQPQLDAAADGGCATPGAPWVLEQHNGAASSAGAPMLSVTVAPTTAGDLIVVGVQAGDPIGSTSVGDNAGTAYQLVPGTAAVLTTGGGDVELWYAPSANGGATTITATASTLVNATVAWELRTSRPATIDTAGQLSDQSTTTMPNAPAITTRCDGELVIAAVVLHAGGVIGIAAGNEFTNDETTDNNGWAHITDPNPPAGPHQAVWTTTLDTYCATAAAFVVE
jgi:hypothetical protein